MHVDQRQVVKLRQKNLQPDFSLKRLNGGTWNAGSGPAVGGSWRNGASGVTRGGTGGVAAATGGAATLPVAATAAP